MSNEFHIDVHREDGTAQVKPVGELDLATVEELDARLRALHGEGVRRVVLDLRGLTFMDSTGLRLTLRWSLASERNGFDFALVRGDRAIRRLFELSGVDRRVRFAAPDG